MEVSERFTSLQEIDLETPVPKIEKSHSPNSSKIILEQYLSTLSLKDKDRYLFLLEKNNKLKEELTKITSLTEDIILKEKEKQKARNLLHNHKNDTDLEKSRAELANKQQKILQLRKRIKNRQKEVQKNYHVDLLREKEDELHNLQRVLKELNLEKTTLMRINDDQEKFLQAQINQEECLRHRDIISLLKEKKEKCRLLAEEKNLREKEIYYLHGQVIDEKTSLREIAAKIQENKNNNINQESPEEIKHRLKNCEAEIEKLKSQRELIINDNEAKLKGIDKTKKELFRDIDKLENIIQEREKEIRFNGIRIKEIKRYSKFSESRPSGTLTPNPIASEISDENSMVALRGPSIFKTDPDPIKDSMQTVNSQEIKKPKHKPFLKIKK